MEKFIAPKRSAKEIAERERILSHALGAFTNEWVAVWDSEVVAYDKDLGNLIEKIAERDAAGGIEATFFVLEEMEGAAIFLSQAA